MGSRQTSTACVNCRSRRIKVCLLSLYIPLLLINAVYIHEAESERLRSNVYSAMNPSRGARSARGLDWSAGDIEARRSCVSSTWRGNKMAGRSRRSDPTLIPQPTRPLRLTEPLHQVVDDSSTGSCYRFRASTFPSLQSRWRKSSSSATTP